jgi:hypothetical protein
MELKKILALLAVFLVLGLGIVHSEETVKSQEKTNLQEQKTEKNKTDNKPLIGIGKDIREQAKTLEKTGSIRAEWAKSIRGEQLLKIREKLLSTKEEYEKAKQQWAEEKRKCENEGNCSKYFNKTKELVIKAIEKVQERLESVNASSESIQQLDELKAKVENTTTIDELRAIYKEVKEKLKEAAHLHARLALKHVAELYLERIEAKPDFPGKQELISNLQNIIATAEQKEPVEIVKELNAVRKTAIKQIVENKRANETVEKENKTEQ